MSAAENNMVLQLLREMRSDMAEMKADIAEIKSDVSDVDQKVNGLTVMMAMLAGHVHDIEERVESLEGDKS